MKKTVFKVLVTFCFAIAMILGSCGDGSDDDKGGGGGGIGGGGGGVNSGLNGTWVFTYEGTEFIKIVLNNGNITESSLLLMSSPSLELSETRKGTYSTKGNNITINFTQVNGNASNSFGLSPSQWYTEQEVRTPFIQYWLDGDFGMAQYEAEEMYDEMESSYLKVLGFGSFTGTYTLSGNTLTFTFSSSNTMYSLGVFTRQ
ncbi:MAG: hypothetical protein LBQ82_09145 [Treponema sp.]|jgi:hypothetical protein|nr:hypothetical protein [Treponema sp.]